MFNLLMMTTLIVLQVAALLTKNKGFISHHAFIATSGMNGGVPFTHPINVTAYGSTSESLVPKNVYSMNCKLIGSNNDRDDHLHFENNNRINLGPAENFPEIFIEELLDKISIVAMGIVVAREIIRDPAYQSKPTVVVTLKSTDYDPIVSHSIQCSSSSAYTALPYRPGPLLAGYQNTMFHQCAISRKHRIYVNLAENFN
jgi:hypothetical protein